MHLVHILPIANYWEWRRRDNLVLLVGERKRELNLVLLAGAVWLLLFILKLNYNPFTASLCCCRHSREYRS